jgi:hypothetical protein
MTDRVLLRKQAVDALVEREVEQIRKRHPELSEGECYSLVCPRIVSTDLDD